MRHKGTTQVEAGEYYRQIIHIIMVFLPYVSLLLDCYLYS
jgi:hypothetical protein